MENLEDLQEQLLQGIAAARDLKALDDARVAALGKKGCITENMKGLGALPTEEKIAAGKRTARKMTAKTGGTTPCPVAITKRRAV